MKNLVKLFVYEEQGQDLIEYALLAGLISIICITAIDTLGQTVNGIWTTIDTTLAAS